MPLPLAAIPPIVTAVGRFAVPYLAKELGKIGTNKFVQTYGNEAFTGLNEALTKNTTMVNTEAIPMVNPNFSFTDDGDDDPNLPSVKDQQKSNKPKQEPPKKPDLGEEILTNVAIKELEKKVSKEKDVKSQTEELVRGIGDNNPPSPIDDINDQTEKLLDKKDTKELTTQNFLDDKLMDELLVMRGGIKGFKERMSGPMAPMPASTKAKMEMELQNKLFAKYKINEYPEGETPETVTKERQDYLIHTYNKRLAAIEYITSVAYDVIGTKDKDSLLVVDEDGLPLAGAKIAIPGSGRINQSDVFSKDALVIVEAGSVFREAGDQLFNDIIQKAKDEGKKYVVAEDLTSEGALQAMKDRGFRTPTTKDTKKFKGKKIRRPSGRSAVQKNLVYIIK